MKKTIAILFTLAVPATAFGETKLSFRGPIKPLKSGTTGFVSVEAKLVSGDLSRLRERYAPGEAGYRVDLVTSTQGCAVQPTFSLSKHSKNVLSSFTVDTGKPECAKFLDEATQRGLEWRIVDGAETIVVRITPAH